MKHDRLFKELLSNFFVEFIELFLPAVRKYLDDEVAAMPLDKEIFSDVTSGDRHEVDLLMKVKIRGSDAYFIVHIENQSSTDAEFPKRMFRYFARLTERFGLPVYPVVIYSHSKPLRREPDFYEVTFPDRNVLRFEYAVIQLNQLPWRRFVSQANPVAAALMARMQMTTDERPKVKLECLRLLARLKVEPAKMQLIGGFIESYLKLTTDELKQYEREMSLLSSRERKSTMALVTSWELKGIKKGKEDMVIRQLRRRLGGDRLEGTIGDAVSGLSPALLDKLGEALLDFSSTDDLQKWLKKHKRP